MRVYLADLGHNQLTLSSDIYPISVANCAVYAQEYLKNPGQIEFRLFREPEDLKAALDSAPPEVLGLSSFAWNHELSCQFAQYAKRKSPRTVTLMGGPNYPLTPAEQESWLRGMPEIDVAVRGPTYEGERAFLAIMQRLVDTGWRREELRTEPVPGSHWIHPVTGDFVRGPEVPRILDLDEIPSPYLRGWMDPYYTSGYFPMLQIARGCPFTCQFCNSSVRENSKVYAHSVKNVCEDLLHIAQRVKPELPVCFADDNFGMYARDEEIADYIAWLQDKFGWPKYIRTTTGKNQAERIIRVMRKVRGTLPMTSAVQSLNPEVLENIKRANIKLDTYAEIQKEVHAQGMQSYGELILSMPGESKASFMAAVHDLLDTGVDRISAHQLMLLHGAPLSNPESRERFQLKTKFRVVARNIGNYLGEPVLETEEMVIETPTFSFAEYFETRVFHLLLTIYYYEGNFEEAFQYARQSGVKPYHLMVRLQEMLTQAPEGFRRVIQDFVSESREELFDSRQECIAWAKANFDDLVSGKLGGNLLSKYSMLGRFYATQDAIDFLEQGIRDCLAREGRAPDPEGLRAVMDYLRSVVLHTPFAEAVEAQPRWTANLDVERWASDGYSRPLADYRLDERVEHGTIVPEERKALILTRVGTFGEHPHGLGKFTRTMFARDLRRVLVPAHAPTAQGVPA
ncbi:MAG: hypothetical protein OEW17_06535 [Gemmatimonadota bacterium]|nr:hypothetical protein [Gemmatimonadota bacterium]MDH5282855.1 hypothetical protein [Gemmatimonadota bacterium]